MVHSYQVKVNMMSLLLEWPSGSFKQKLKLGVNSPFTLTCFHLSCVAFAFHLGVNEALSTKSLVSTCKIKVMYNPWSLHLEYLDLFLMLLPLLVVLHLLLQMVILLL